MKKHNRIMEYFWLAVAGISLIIAMQMIYRNGFAQVYEVCLLPMAAAGLWYLRRRYRMRLEEKEKKEC